MRATTASRSILAAASAVLVTAVTAGCSDGTRAAVTGTSTVAATGSTGSSPASTPPTEPTTSSRPAAPAKGIQRITIVEGGDALPQTVNNPRGADSRVGTGTTSNRSSLP